MVLCACWSFKEILVSKPTKQLIQVGPISTDVVTNEIREAIPRRVSFFVSSDIDSRIAINQTGAQRLGGIGDCIYTDINSEGLIHAQAAYVTDFDIGRVVKKCQEQWAYSPEE